MVALFFLFPIVEARAWDQTGPDTYVMDIKRDIGRETYEEIHSLDNVLRQGAAGKTIIINYESPGGTVYHGKLMMDILERWQSKGAIVIGNVGYACHSMCSTLLFASTDINVAPNALVVVHTIQICGATMCRPEVAFPVFDVLAWGAWVYIQHYIYPLYIKPLLTPEEREAYWNGENVGIRGADLQKRWEVLHGT